MQHGIEKISRAVAGKHPSRPIGAVRARREAQRQHPRPRVAEGGHGLAPVLAVGIGAAAHPRHLGAVRAQPLAALAGNDAGIQIFQRRAGSSHAEILGHLCAIFLLAFQANTGASQRCRHRQIPSFCAAPSRWPRENVVRGAGGPFGAVIVRDGRIVGEGVNTVTAAHDPTAHAEVNAIRAACKALGTFSLAGCQLYSSCEPCPMCLAAAYWARIDAIYYGASAADAARAGFDDAFIYQELRKDRRRAQAPRHATARRGSLGQLCRLDRLAEQDRVLKCLARVPHRSPCSLRLRGPQ